jgi:hypothetical protein
MKNGHEEWTLQTPRFGSDLYTTIHLYDTLIISHLNE